MKAAPPPRPVEPPHDPTVRYVSDRARLTPAEASAGLHNAAAAGHLARLVQRAHPTEAVLHRRQPSMFERAHPLEFAVRTQSRWTQ